MLTRSPSKYFYDAIEDSEVLLIEPGAHDRLVAEVPGYAASFRTGLLRHAAAKDQRIAESLRASAEERYVNFLATYPTIATRVPQFMLASYLGVSPENPQPHSKEPVTQADGGASPGEPRHVD